MTITSALKDSRVQLGYRQAERSVTCDACSGGSVPGAVEE